MKKIGIIFFVILGLRMGLLSIKNEVSCLVHDNFCYCCKNKFCFPADLLTFTKEINFCELLVDGLRKDAS